MESGKRLGRMGAGNWSGMRGWQLVWERGNGESGERESSDGSNAVDFLLNEFERGVWRFLLLCFFPVWNGRSRG